MADRDTLTAYKAKRNFSVTTEPIEDVEGDNGARTYVIQKHWARNLHYDFRLELDGTMKSWAVPKGPSLDSSDKRMAVHVEDHPIAYRNFEGVIPPKQYGAGKVIIWDKGTWCPRGDAREGYRKGNLKFELRGFKLRGSWALIRMKGKEGKGDPWLLIKENDEYMRPASEFSVVDEQPNSVKAQREPVANATPGDAKVKAAPHAKSEIRLIEPDKLPLEAIKAALPASLAPQLATLVSGPPSNADDWVYEIKFDGYRLLTRIDDTNIRMFTRNGNDWTSKLLPLQKALIKLKLPSGWYDGEIVVPDDHGVPDFGALQQSFDQAKTHDIVLYLFDIPYFDGHDLRAVPLEARRELLKRTLKRTACENVRFSEVFDAPLKSILASACQLGLEGVVAKRRDSTYVSRRSPTWIKLKCSHRQEFVIAGYTRPQGTRLGIGALLLGVHGSDGGLLYVGKVGTGFNQSKLAMLRTRLGAVGTKAHPFLTSPAGESGAYWVKPTLVAEVTFGGWTRDGRIRHGGFRGIRTDKDPSMIVREPVTRIKAVAKPAQHFDKAANALSSRLRVTNADRVLDSATGTTKIELIRYYDLVADLIMEHLKNRPISLLRAPGGVDEKMFFQKHAETEKLPGIHQLDPILDGAHLPMLTIATKQGLLSAAQWNVLEFHTANAISSTYAHPDRMVLDLDPGEGVSWAHVQEAAMLVNAFLTQLGLSAFLKTSGGKGLHIIVPLRKVHDWNTVKGFSRVIVAHLAKTIPQRFVVKSGSSNRRGKIFIDYLRNGVGATTVSAWSARARPGLGISVPVEWSELKCLTGGDHWSVRTVHTRLDRGNAAWHGYAKSARNLTAAMKILAYTPLVALE